jgi:predicted membrane channel-forming protein YqfA (hemolysin III family)
MTPLRYLNAWLGIGAALVALVAFLSLTPNPLETERFHEVKVGHFIAYGTLMLWFAQIFRSTQGRIGVGLSLALMGVVLEYLQGATGYRTFAYADMRDNALGVVAGLTLAYAGLGGVLGRLDGWLAHR